MEENRPFRSRPASAGRYARRRLRALFLTRLARLVRLRSRVPSTESRRRKFLDQPADDIVGRGLEERPNPSSLIPNPRIRGNQDSWTYVSV